jgi:hexokinase
MGKGFLASDGLVGHDLGTVLREACLERHLSVSLRALMNDADAALFSQAYTHAGTRMGLILGTGANVSCYLPVASIRAPGKFGAREAAWFAAASHVLVNTELDCCGGDGVMPETRWDNALRRVHPRPDFQPFEYYTSGRYLGEICRLVLVEAITKAGAFGGAVPPTLEAAYSLDTEVLTAFEG